MPIKPDNQLTCAANKSCQYQKNHRFFLKGTQNRLSDSKLTSLTCMKRINRRFLKILNCLAIICLTAVPPVSLAREAGWVKAPQPVENSLKGMRAKSQDSHNSKNKSSVISQKKSINAVKKGQKAEVQNTAAFTSVYDQQPVISEQEVKSFIILLPQFRSWTRENGEEAHPILSKNGKPDFLYSRNASDWVLAHNFEPRRFFCVMGKMAAAMVIVEEGNDYKGTRPADMPPVSTEELDLARKYLGELLSASGPPLPLK